MIAIVGTRVAASAALFLLLVLLSAILPPPWFVVLLGAALVAVPALTWLTFWFFAKRALAHPEMLALRVQVQDALALALASTAGGLLGFVGLARVLNLIPSIGSLVTVGIAFVLLMIAAPAVNWLVVWRPWRSDE